MTLPNPEQAVVDIIKIRDYCLNPEHRRAQHKARVFSAVLGLKPEHAELLRQELLSAARTHQATSTEQDNYGQRYQLEFTMTGPNGQQATIRSSWIVRRGENFAPLTTCYVL